jgi:molecular chaperone GrpE
MSEESPESTAAAPSAEAADVESDESVEERNDAAVENGVSEAERDSTSAEGEAASEEASGSAEPDVPDVADRVAEYDEELAAEVSELESRLAAASSELDAREDRIAELESALKRSKADFKNYKKRAKKRQDEIRERATEDFVSRVVSVRDNLVRALDQDEGADIRPGIESTLEEFDRVLEEENVDPIDPDPGTDVDPTRHEVLMRVDDERPGGTVVEVYRPGYEMAGTVLREAQVTVSTGEPADDE